MIWKMKTEAAGEIRNYCFLYEVIKDNRIKLLRVWGSEPVAVIPEMIDGKLVSTIGAYCFAEKDRLTKEQQAELQDAVAGQSQGWEQPQGQPQPPNQEPQQIWQQSQREQLRPLCGDYITEVVLPDSVVIIETYAFYNCRNLKQLEVGKNLSEINSDVFMNCKSLHRLVIRCSIMEKSGLRLLLNQLTVELEVSFVKENNTEAKILYPEYTESYEEIGPAHIFQLRVEGEGYRARRQFQDGIVDIGAYDQIFERASNEEKTFTLMKMALNRLLYPVGLVPEREEVYRNYLEMHETEIMEKLVRRQDLDALEYLCQTDYISEKAYLAAVRQAAAMGWTRGSAALIRFRKKHETEDEYDTF